MIVTILLGVSAVLYLAGIFVATEYVDFAEEYDAKFGVPKMTPMGRRLAILSWPALAIIAQFVKGK